MNTLSLNVETPLTSRVPVVVNPEKLAFLHLFNSGDSSPISYVASSVGVKLDANSPPITTSSVSWSPILIVPPLKVTIPINSEDPPTYKFCSTLKLPSNVTPAPTRNVSSMSTVEFMSTGSENVEKPAMLIFPPTFKFLARPTPPEITKAPVVVDAD